MQDNTLEKYSGQAMVVKYGGSAMQSEELKNSVMKDIIELSQAGIKVALVHGGGPELSSMLNKLGKETKFVDGLRYTDEETVGIATMVFAGKINKDLAAHVYKLGGKAVGVCGIDGGLIKAEKIQDKDLGYVGRIISINTELLDGLMDSGFIPIIATVGIGEDGQVYNINADTAASEIAVALKADRLVSLSDVRGILRDKDDASSLISTVTVSEIPSLIESGVIVGGMIPKVEGCIDAMARGVVETSIIDGRVPHSIILELTSDEGIGTLIKK